MERIVYIKTSELYPHPDNPRKDLGELTELADSIKAKGVMQNLTVVPRDGGGYTVIIGHRRCGAAKLAGLTELPCVISDMSPKEQLETMMLENMQRSDLTIYEQAQGFQLMFDFGESIDEIAEKTGISKTTVRNRMKLTRYDAELMKQAALRQPTMEQYMRLSEIEDEHVANECLRFIGTKNFDNEVAKAIRVQKEKKEREILRELFARKCEKLLDASYEAIKQAKLISVETFYSSEKNDIEKKLDEYTAKHGKLYYSESYGFSVYRKWSKADDERMSESEQKRSARAELEKRANDMFDDLVERAEGFVSEYKSKKGDFEKILALMFRQIVEGRNDHQGSSFFTVAEALGYKLDDGRQSWSEDVRAEAKDFILDCFEEKPCETVLRYLFETNQRKKPHFLSYRETKLSYNTLNFSDFMLLIEELGYNVSDEEWELLDGRHELFNIEVPI